MKSPEQQQSEKNQQFAAAGSDLRVGTCLSIDWVAGTARVNVPGAVLDLPMVVAPVVNARCYVGFFANRPVVLGPVARPPLATAAGSPSGGIVKVTGDDGQTYLIASDGFTITAGTRVMVGWGDRGGYVTGLPSADPFTGIAIGSAGTTPGGGQQTRTFYPAESGTQNSSYGGSSGSGNYWTDQVYCGDTTIGGYFYGSSIPDTIPDSAAILSVVVTLRELSGSGASPTIALHGLGSKGAGNLAPISPVTVGAGSGDKVLPNSFGDALKTGAVLGLATLHGGYHIFDSFARSGALTITYQV